MSGDWRGASGTNLAAVPCSATGASMGVMSSSKKRSSVLAVCAKGSMSSQAGATALAVAGVAHFDWSMME